MLYCHLESILISKGELIELGQVIGIEGRTGNATGIHLHLELRESPYNSNNHISPASYLGILNKVGKVQEEENYIITVEEANNKLRTILEEQTVQYLNFYKYADELVVKLVKNMK